MKVGRNDPCPCGSGKKYKKCCLGKAAERVAAQQRAAFLQEAAALAAAPAAAQPPTDTTRRAQRYTPPPPPQSDPPPLTAEEEAREERWLAFKRGDASSQAAIFRDALSDDLFDDEDAFEMLTLLHEQRKVELYITLAEALEQARPELYAESAVYYLEFQIAAALAHDDLERLRRLTSALAATAGRDLDMFYLSYDRLAYHGHLHLLAETMTRAWPLVRESDAFLPGSDDEFAARAQQMHLLAYIERTPTPRADDPELATTLEQFGAVDYNYLQEIMALIAGQAVQPWDDTSGEVLARVERLGFRFLGELVRRWGMPFSRAELARVEIVGYIAVRLDPSSPGGITKKRLQQQAKRGVPLAHLLLCPERKSLEPYVTQHFDLIGSRPVEAAITLEAMPAWLQFLQDQGLIGEEQRAAALQDLRDLVDDAEAVWENYALSYPFLGPNVRAAWAGVV